MDSQLSDISVTSPLQPHVTDFETTSQDYGNFENVSRTKVRGTRKNADYFDRKPT